MRWITSGVSDGAVSALPSQPSVGDRKAAPPSTWLALWPSVSPPGPNVPPPPAAPGMSPLVV